MEIITFNFVNDLARARNLTKMSSVMPFSFNTVELCVVTINEKSWTRANEACGALGYNKKTAHVIKGHVSPENYAQKYQMSSVPAAVTPISWPKDSQKYETNEKGMYEMLFSSQQPKAKNFRRHCFNVLFPHVRKQLTNKILGEHQQAITDRENQMKALEFRNEEYQQKILKLNKEIDELIKNRHVVRRGCFDNVLCFIKKNSKKRPTNNTLFDANIDSLKNMRDVLNFVILTWSWLTNAMIQMHGTYSRVKWSRNLIITKTISA